MSHTAGFEDRIIGLFAKSQESRPLAELLAKGMPARVYPPGSVTAYSNYGAALAALIVEQVSGVPFGTYLENRILKPLAMNHATILQPVPSPLSADLSKGYQWTDGRLKEQPFEYVPWAPAGAMSASGTDMGRFMMAHLNEGALGASRILRADSARAMRERLPSFSPKLSGMFHGFMEGHVNGETLFGHGGDTIWFHSLTAMFPTRRLGVFVAYNTDSGQRAVQEFLASFVEHFFPSPLAKETLPSKESRESLKHFAGTYSLSRASETDLTKVIKLVGAVSVSVDPDGYLLMRSGNEVTRWRQIEPLLFAQVDGGRRLAFRENDRGDVTALCSSPICVVVMLKEPWWNGQVPQLTWFGFSLAIFAAALVGFPIAAVLQRKQTKPIGAKLARLAAWATSVMFVAGTAAFAVGFAAPSDIVFAVPTATKVALSLWAVSSLLAIGLFVSMVQAWRRHWWCGAGRVCLTLVCGAAVASIAWLYHWNLLGWRY
jgi:Beta-lactamase